MDKSELIPQNDSQTSASLWLCSISLTEDQSFGLLCAMFNQMTLHFFPLLDREIVLDIVQYNSAQ